MKQLKAYVCGECGNSSPCACSLMLHILTAHQAKDIHIPTHLEEDEIKCWQCMLSGTIPYPKLVQSQKEAE